MDKRSLSSRREFILAAGATVAGSGTLSSTTRPGAEADPAPLPSAKSAVPEEVDVLVVGGGPAGIGAALGAARTGVRTLLVENHAFFGGVAAWCLGMPINQMRPDNKPRSKVHELVIEKLVAYGDQAVRSERARRSESARPVVSRGSTC